MSAGSALDPVSLQGATRLILDLDDTLYLERDFVRSGFRAVAEHWERRGGTPGLFDRAWALFHAGARGDIFDQALRQSGEEVSARKIAELVAVYRGHRPRIRLAEDAGRLLDRIPAGAKVGLISDGPEATQRRKLAALGLAGCFDSVVLTGAWGAEFAKPHPRAFDETAERLGGEPSDYAYVADNPRKDFAQPRRKGWRTVRIRRKEGLYADDAGVEAEREVQTLDELFFY